ncbi:MAG: hypothetical protein AW12_03044 [Candidatus Accumulibacter sp. BA-94]|nr:MAG: hypothetical protein AW12_03044 [Candidatus Accumulibacter sp. BA-94]
MARVTSPTTTSSICPKVIAGKTSACPFAGVICNTARSDSGSLPTMRALRLRPSLSAISIWSAASTTW